MPLNMSKKTFIDENEIDHQKYLVYAPLFRQWELSARPGVYSSGLFSSPIILIL
jgi:hypothetical protein